MTVVDGLPPKISFARFGPDKAHKVPDQSFFNNKKVSDGVFKFINPDELKI